MTMPCKFTLCVMHQHCR